MPSAEKTKQMCQRLISKGIVPEYEDEDEPLSTEVVVDVSAAAAEDGPS